MRSLLILVILFLISQVAFGKVWVRDLGNHVSYDFHVEKLSLSKTSADGRSFVDAGFKGVEKYEGIAYEVGLPKIPVVRLLVVADSDSDVYVNFPYKGTSNFAVSSYVKGKIIPNQESQSKSSAKKLPFKMNNAFYSQYKGEYPNKLFKVEDAGSVRGRNQKLVTIYPFQYSPSTGSYKFIRDFSIKVKKAEARQVADKDIFAFVVGKKFKDSAALKKYMTFKMRQGFEIQTINVGEGINTPAQIRAELQKLFRESNMALKYALIIGDVEDVPAEKAHNCSGVTDHYYRAIDTDNYDLDINGPDIGVGRLTVNKESELAGIVDKFIKYQVGEFADQEWLKKIAFLATNDQYVVAEGSHNYAIDTYTKALGISGSFPQEYTEGGDKLYAITHKASGSDSVARIQEGRFIVNYSGHGATTFWDAPRMTQSDVRSLNHSDALPFVISNACITGQFTRSESYGETWIKHPQGAIMYWGSMDSTYWDEDDILERRMYDGIFRDGLSTFRDITQYSLSELWAHYGGQGRMKYYWETYVTFGDPSINLRTKPVDQIEILGPAEIGGKASTVQYRLHSYRGNSVKGVRVALTTSSGYVADVAYTDSEGLVSLNMPSMRSGARYIVRAYGQNTTMDSKLLKVAK